MNYAVVFVIKGGGSKQKTVVLFENLVLVLNITISIF